METKIDLNRVATFVRVIQAGSFTRAARQLGVPISSVSRAVARLESEIDVRLVHRTTRKLALTEAGRQYFTRMSAALAEVDAATSAVAGQAQEPRGTVRVTAPPDGGMLDLAGLITSIVREHPGITIDLMLTGRRLDLIEEGIDLAVRGGVLEDSTLVAHRIGASEFGIVAAPAYLARRGTPRTPADLARHDCVCFRTRAGVQPWRLTGPNGTRVVPVSGSIITDEIAFIYQVALGGGGLAYLPLDALNHDLHAGRLARVLPRYVLPLGALSVVWPSQRLLPARVILVRDCLIAGLTRRMRLEPRKATA